MMTFTTSSHDIPDFFIGSFKNEDNTFLGSEAVFNLCSISKLITSILFLKMLEKKKIKLEDLVKISDASYFSIEILLRHLSGLQDNEELFLPNKKIETNILREQINIKNTGEFNYSDHGYMLLQFWLEEKFNCSFKDLVQTEIFEPLELENMFYIDSSSDVNTKTFIQGYDKKKQVIPYQYSIYPYPATCGLWGSGDNLLTLVREICNGINGDSKLGISQKNYERLIQSDTYDWLGLGCFLEENSFGLEVSSLGWGEGYQSMVVFYPKQMKGLVVLTNRDLGVHQLKGFCGDIYQQWIATV